MAVFKCKMCGGQLEVQENQTVIECEYCGTQQTLPTLDNEKKLNLFNRANRLRMSNEFDKAAGVFESIVAEFPEEAEAYWGLVLCKYGIEYVDDPATGKKVPTCHRTSYDSIFDDNNFEMALEYADGVATSVYRNEAKEIDRLQKAILDIASKEEPFDVFICYKETAEDGQRTKDSVMAEDIYDRLTDKGYKVFFARITLEDKLGQEYEPFIFSALNSAKVMLAIGTKYEYYNAVWVKNEWSRFLEMMKKDKEKLLIPCYADIDAYDMPSEFKNLQGQDMNKIGFIQDLIRGIGKVIPLKKDEPIVQAQTVVTQSAEVPLLKRAFMFLEDGKWNDAETYFNKVLDVNPECGDAYAGLFLVGSKSYSPNVLENNRKTYINNVKHKKESINKETNHIFEKGDEYFIPNYLTKNEIQNMYDYNLNYLTKVDNLTNYTKTENEFWNQDYFNKAKRFNNGQVSKQLVAVRENVKEYLKTAVENANDEEKNNREKLENDYKKFLSLTDEKVVALYHTRKAEKEENERIEAEKQLARSTETYQKAMTLVKNDDANSVKEAIELLTSIPGFKDSDSKVEEFKKLHESIITYDKAVGLLNDNDVNRANQAKGLFVSLGNFRDSNDKVKACDRLINELNAQKKKSNKIIALVLVVVLALSAVGITFVTVIVPNNKYDEAVSLKNGGHYDEALVILEDLNNYNDSEKLILEIYEESILKMINAQEYSEALDKIQALSLVKNGDAMSKELTYKIATSMYENEMYMDSIEIFVGLEEYEDASKYANEAYYQQLLTYYNNKEYTLAKSLIEDDVVSLPNEYKDYGYYKGALYFNYIKTDWKNVSVYDKSDMFDFTNATVALIDYVDYHPEGQFVKESNKLITEVRSHWGNRLKSHVKVKVDYYSREIQVNGFNPDQIFRKMSDEEIEEMMIGTWYSYIEGKKSWDYTFNVNGTYKLVGGKKSFNWTVEDGVIKDSNGSKCYSDIRYVDSKTIVYRHPNSHDWYVTFKK